MILNISLPGKAGKAEFAYTGAYTQKQITSGGVTYDLYTLTGSGTLTVTGTGTAKNVDIWACGGGSSGTGGSGGAGAYCAQLDAQTMTGEYSVTVGAATGNTSVAQSGTAILTANGVRYKTSGGTGGGGKGGRGGTGDGVTKYPFGDSTAFKCHCAGGGGGGDKYDGYINVYEEQQWVSSNASGGRGGTNGGSGAAGSSTGNYGGSGGNYGGGDGGSGRSSSSANGSNATFYGSGGGGYGSYHADPSVGIQGGSSGSGYQGVVYIRVPVT